MWNFLIIVGLVLVFLKFTGLHNFFLEILKKFFITANQYKIKVDNFSKQENKKKKARDFYYKTKNITTKNDEIL